LLRGASSGSSVVGEWRGAPLALERVSAGYRPRRGDEIKDVIREVTLTLGEGEIVVLVGANGAGKSTCLRVLSGVLAPRQGKARLFGRDIAELSRREVASQIAVVAQGDEAATGFRVDQVVMMGRSPHQGSWHRPTPGDDVAVADALGACGIEHLAHRLVAELSGGEQKLVSLARAFAQDTRILLLDEPSAHLDARRTVTLLDRVTLRVRERGTACLAIVHDLNLAAAFADRVVLLHQGSVRAEGPPHEVMTAENLRVVLGLELEVGAVGGAAVFVPRLARNRA
jgi:ABC-type cobalamin/Fe3+-siderophores transport system ATPase subunit